MGSNIKQLGLREAPFRLATDAGAFFAGGGRGTLLDTLQQAVTDGTPGIIAVTGETGSGKTRLCRALADRISAHRQTLVLTEPRLSPENLRAVLPQSGAQVRPLVLLIDEAHTLPAETLQAIGQLAETGSAPALVLFGQPELNDRLALVEKDGKPLPIARTFPLPPLSREEIGAYLALQLHAAGGSGLPSFTEEAVERLSQLSGGLLRRVNLLADGALQAAFSAGKQAAEAGDVDLAARQVRFAPPPPQPRSKRSPAGVALLTAVVVVAGLAVWSGRSHLREDGNDARKGVAIQPAKPTAEAPLQPLPPRPVAKVRFGPLTRQHLAQFDDWIATAPSRHYFIQLLATDATHTGQIEGFLASATGVLNPSLIRAYRSSLSGRDRVGVIYGDFATREEAVAALQQLPDSIKAAQPFPRQVSRLR